MDSSVYARTYVPVQAYCSFPGSGKTSYGTDSKDYLVSRARESIHVRYQATDNERKHVFPVFTP